MELKVYTLLATSSMELLKSTGWLLGLLFGVGFLWYLVDHFTVKDPFNKILKAILIVVALVLIIRYVIHVAGPPPF